MHVVHIYAESDRTTPKSVERMTGYVLECEGKEGDTRDGFLFMAATYNAAMLSTLCTALSRLHRSSEVHIHTQNSYILNMIEYNLPLWAANSFQNKKGEPIKNGQLWMDFWRHYQKHLVVTEAGLHPYLLWFEGQFRKKREELPEPVNTKWSGISGRIENGDIFGK